jgi:hypothetical protein
MNKKFKGASTLVATDDPAGGTDAGTYDEAAESETAASDSAGTADSEQVMARARTTDGTVTPDLRQAAADRAVALRPDQATSLVTSPSPAVIDPNAPPDYFGPYPNYANNPFPTVDPVTQRASGGQCQQFA